MSIRKLLLGSSQLKLLKDISQILGAPARVQQLLSFEKTPALSVALPSYEWLLRQFKNFRVTIKELAWALNPAIDKLEEYVVRSRTCSAHALAMSESQHPKHHNCTDILSHSVESYDKTDLDGRTLD